MQMSREGRGCEISGERAGSIFNFLHAGCMNYFLEQPIMPVSESSNCDVQRDNCPNCIYVFFHAALKSFPLFYHAC